MKFTEFTESNKHTLTERPATAGALGTGLSPQQFEVRYGMTPAQAELSINNVVELNPGYKSPAVKDSLRQYMLQNPQALTAANENVKPPSTRFRVNPGAFLKGLPGRLLGAVGLIFTPSDLADGTVTPEIQLQMDFEKHLAENDSAVYVKYIDDQWDSLTDEQKKENEQFDPRDKQEYIDAKIATTSFDPASPDAPVIEPPTIDPTPPAPLQPEPSYPDDDPNVPLPTESPPGWPADVPWDPAAPEGPPRPAPAPPKPETPKPRPSPPVIPDPTTPKPEEPKPEEPKPETPKPRPSPPVIPDPTTPKPEEPKPEEPKPETKPDEEPEVKPEPETKPDEEPEVKPEPETKPDEEPEPELAPQSLPLPGDSIPLPLGLPGLLPKNTGSKPGPGLLPKNTGSKPGFILPKRGGEPYKFTRLPPRLIHLRDPMGLKRNIQ